MNLLLVTIAAVATLLASDGAKETKSDASPAPDAVIDLAAPRLAGSNRIVWAVRNRSAIDGAEPLEVYYCPRSSQPLPFRPLTGTTIRGRVRQLAAYSGSLHVFLDGGAHYRFQIPDSDQASRTWSPERRLGEGSLPMALAADDDANCLFAIVDEPTARKLELSKPDEDNDDVFAVENDDDKTEPTSSRDENDQGNAANGATDIETNTPSDATPPSNEATEAEQQAQVEDSRFVLVRYRNREWTRVASVPIELDGEKPIWIAARGEKVWLLGVTQTTNAAIWSDWNGSQWSEPADLDTPPERVVVMMIPDKAPAILVRGSGEKADLTPWLLTDGEWQRQSPLSIAGAPLIESADDISISHFGSRIVASWRTAESGVQAAIWSPSGGDALVDPRAVAILSITPTSPQNEQLQVLVGVVILIALLSIIFARRRESFLVDLPMPAGYELASYYRRLIAFVIDLLIVAVAAYPIILYPWMSAHVDMKADLTEQIDQVKIAVMAEPDAVFWRWMAAASAFVVYGVVTELMFAATLGKMIMGLRVSSDKGGRCSPQAILLRNLLRFIELYPAMQFAPTLIFVLMTRNRQRIGDLVARTVVIERSAAPQPTPSTPRTRDEESEANAPSDDE